MLSSDCHPAAVSGLRSYLNGTMIESLVWKHTALIAHWAIRRVSNTVWLAASAALVVGRTLPLGSRSNITSTKRYRANRCRA